MVSSEPLVAHSLAEAHLYLRATPCTSCGRGPLRASDTRSVGAPQSPLAKGSTPLAPLDKGGKGGEEVTVTVTATCDACQSVTSPTFRLPAWVALAACPPVCAGRQPGKPGFPGARGTHAEEPAVVNPTDEPSRILDVGQWIMLSRMLLEAGSKEAEKGRARRLGIEAAQCLEEALKFYDELDNDLPPPEALFDDASRERFRDAPEQFSRRRLIELRSKLPTTLATPSSPSAPKKRPWWRRWLLGVDGSGRAL